MSLCWTCSFAGEHGHSGLCGICKRMEHYRQEHEMLPTALNVLPVQLILSEEFMPWAASQAVVKANEETELVEVGK